MTKRSTPLPLRETARRVAPGERRNARAIRAVCLSPSALTGPALSHAAGEVRT
jgi:hypothetical protein